MLKREWIYNQQWVDEDCVHPHVSIYESKVQWWENFTEIMLWWWDVITRSLLCCREIFLQRNELSSLSQSTLFPLPFYTLTSKQLQQQRIVQITARNLFNLFSSPNSISHVKVIAIAMSAKEGRQHFELSQFFIHSLNFFIIHRLFCSYVGANHRSS